MSRSTSGRLGLVLVLALLLGTVPAATAADPATDRAPATPAADPGPELVEPEIELPRTTSGAAAIRLLGDQLEDAAELNGLSAGTLRQVLRSDDSAHLATNGRMFYADPAVPERAGASGPPPATFPLAETMTLHSNPGSSHTIYLDFDGGDLGGTLWADVYPDLPRAHPAWDPSGDGPAFDDAERRTIQAIWTAVAEDYAPFDVDVTTEAPDPDAIHRDSEADQEFGSRVLFTRDQETFRQLCSTTCSGIAWTGGFGSWTSPAGDDGYGTDRTALVIPPSGTSTDPSGTQGRTASHEVGHQLGLFHDGSPAGEYYAGHGNAWLPIMGSGARPLSQWSKGDYPGADQHQDDVAIIADVLGLRADEAPDSPVGAAEVPAGTAYIGTRDDVDVHRLGRCTGPVTVDARTLARNANLDLSVSLLDAAGTTLASAAPPVTGGTVFDLAGLGATLTRTLEEGSYYVAVDGTGDGTWATNGYDDYGSLGAYTIEVTGDCDGTAPSGVPSEPRDLAAAADPALGAVDLTWTPPASAGDAPVTGYVVQRSGSSVSTRVPADRTTLRVTGLELSTTYDFRVTAVSDRGPGATSVVTVRTADPVAPSAPRDLAVAWQSLNRNHEVTWDVPADDGGAPLIGYDVVIGTNPAVRIDPSMRSMAFRGGGDVRVEVRAVTRAGSSPAAVTTYRVTRPPAHDAFQQRAPLSGASGRVAADNTYATRELHDPRPPSTKTWAGRASLWFSWTAPTHGPATFATSSDDPARDTTLAVYTGGDQASLTQVAGDDDRAADDRLSEVTFEAVAGTTYAIVVDGVVDDPSGTGPFELSWQAAPPAPTTTSLVASTTGRSVTLTATVSSDRGTPAGTVSFAEGGTDVGTADVVDGVAELVLDAQEPGRHEYVATYRPAGTVSASSTSGPTAVTVAPVATSTALRITRAERSVTLDVTVTAPVGTPEGTVELVEADEVLDTVRLVDGSASATLSDVASGPHTYRARFVPADAVRFAPSASSGEDVRVGAPTSTTATARVSGRAVTVSVQVTSPTGQPDGDVTVTEAGVPVGSATVVDGAASVSLTGVASGAHRYDVRFTPTTDHLSSATSVTADVAAGATSTVLTGSAEGRTVTLHAAVGTDSGPAAAGTVEILEGSAVVGTATVRDGDATVRLTGVSPGQHDYRARFLPADDAVHATSTSDPLAVTVEKIASSTALAATVTGRTVELVATVTTPEGSASGDVVLREGDRVVGSGALVDGSASVTLTDVPPGTRTYTATFVSDDPAIAGSVSSERTVSVARVATATAVSASVRERTVTLQVEVTAGAVRPEGAVEILDEDGTPVGSATLVAGAATVVVRHVTPGSRTFTASFVPDDTVHAGSERSVTATVSDAPVTTTTTVQATVSGRMVTLGAQVTSDEGVPEGEVVLHDGGEELLRVPLVDGAASGWELPVTRGTHHYTATYLPPSGSMFAGSVSARTTIDVTGVVTTTTLTATPGDSSVTLAASVSAGDEPVHGVVELYRGDTLVESTYYGGGSVEVVVPRLVGGVHDFRAVFVADEVFAGSEATASATVAATSTTTSLTVAVDGHRVRLTADVSADLGSPVGTVSFRDGDVVVATAPVTGSGEAAVVLADVTTGEHRYTASFVPGDGVRHAASTSDAQVTHVEASPTTTAMEASADGTTVRFAVEVESPDGVPAGTVEIVEDGQVRTSVALGRDGTGRVSLLDVAVGRHTYAARYVPAGDYHRASDSASHVVTVTGAPAVAGTTTGLVVTAVRRTVTLRATVTGGGAGRVELRDGGVAVGSAPVVGGRADLTLRAVAAGKHSYTATYVPADARTYAGSSSAAQPVTVAASVTTTSLTGRVSGSSVSLAAVVTAPDGIVPRGRVQVRDGSRVVAVANLDRGRASVALARVAVGSHSYRAVFLPATGDEAGSTSRVVTLRVVRPPVATRTTIKAPRTATEGARPVVTIRVVGGTATGTVVLTHGKKKTTLRLRRGTASFKLPKVKAGTLKLSVRYSGDAASRPSSAKATIKVAKKKVRRR